MTTRRFVALCDRLLEAGWLLALVWVPAFFNVYSQRVFEPDKIASLRTLVTLMLAVWLAKGFALAVGGESRKIRLRAWLTRMPLAIPILFYAAVYLLSTLFSVHPSVSVWGSYQRLQGLYSTYSYILLALFIATTLRRPEQIERFVNTVLLISLPIALYGWLQHYRLDPLPWGGDVTRRVTSTMGNAIFIAAYLILTVPFTLYRLRRLWGQMAAAEEEGLAPDEAGWLSVLAGTILLDLLILYGTLRFMSQDRAFRWWVFPLVLFGVYLSTYLFHLPEFRTRWARRIQVVGVGTLLGIQLVAIFWSYSRGPWLGLLAALIVTSVVWAYVQNQRALFWVYVALGILAVATLAYLNFSPDPVAERFREIPWVGRLGRLFETERGTGRVRVLIWFGDEHGKGVAGMVTADPWRTLIGYGPETMYVAYNPFYPPELAHYEARNATPDRSHNVWLDKLVITGALGLLAYLFLFLSAFAFVWQLLREGESYEERLLYLTLGGVILAHLVEASVGIPIAATRTYLWASLGLLMAAASRVYGRIPLEEGEPAASLPPRGAGQGKRGKGKRRRSRRGAAAPSALPLYGVLAFLLAVALGFSLEFNLRPIYADMIYKQGLGVENVAYQTPGPQSFPYWAQAIDRYRRATELAPREDFYYLFLGRAYLERAKRQSTPEARDADLRRAEAALKRAYELSPLNTDHSANLGRLYKIWHEITGDPTKLDEALRWYERAVQRSPNNAVLWTEYAVALLGKGDVAGATEKVQRALALDDRYAPAYVIYGDLLRMQDRAVEAAEAYRRSVELDPQPILDPLFESRVQYLAEKGLLGSIAEALKAQVPLGEAKNRRQRRYQRNPQILMSVGFALAQAGRTEEAIAYFRRAAEVNPRNFLPHQNLALLYRDLGRYQEALQEVSLALEYAPENARAGLEALRKQLEQALRESNP